MVEFDFNYKDLLNLHSLEVTFVDLYGKIHTVRANIENVNEHNIMIFFPYMENFNQDVAKQVNIKYVTDNVLYSANVKISSSKVTNDFLYLTVFNPVKVRQLKQRRWYRLALERECVLIAKHKDNPDNNEIYMVTILDVSAGGTLLYRLKSVFDNNPTTIDPNNYSDFIIILFLDVGSVFNIHAKCVRYESRGMLRKYAFEFVNMTNNDIDMLVKYITKSQIKKRK